MHVFEEAAHARAERELLLHANALEDRCRQASVVRRPSRHRSGHGAQRVAEIADRLFLEAAGDAFLEVALDEHALVHRQLTVVIRGEILAHAIAGEDVHHTRTSRSCSRSVCRARVSRDLTVPTATSSDSAMSS